MNPTVVADVGNTRIKWGRCDNRAVVEMASLSADDPHAWEKQLESWGMSQPQTWLVAGVHPKRRDQLAEWLRTHHQQVRILESPADLPLVVHLNHPERAGIDRLLDAVAATHRKQPGRPAVVVDAGSAVTVDWLDEQGAFCGGAIFPGMRLMAQSLHDYTALLPVVHVRDPHAPLPGHSTIAAMEAGIFWAVAGGIRALIEHMNEAGHSRPDVFLTGGDCKLLAGVLGPSVQVWPEMTLEGIRYTAESLP